ncbi:histone deacetylase HDT2-like isoform X2 [Panicum virgatum]|uniref:histone deacetylase HDT2-like isoform X2 n=1 Tax=Panicum virgatum TaxID=38727 RepID=UPI0019D597D8|nr:histone deacetylase HDT2-like isoform X2 [Panicum virgatum]
MSALGCGVLLRPGETVKCNPGELCCHISQLFVQIALQDDKGDEDVRVFVKVNGNIILIGTLSVDKYPQCKIGLVFEKEFELMHTSKNSIISALGYTFRQSETKSYSYTSTDEVDDSDEEVPLTIPLYPNADDDKSKETESGAEKPTAAQLCKPNNILEETKDPEKLKADVGGTDNDDSDENAVDSVEGESGDDEDSSDEDDSDSSDEVDGEAPKDATGKIRPAETPLRTPVEKKAKITTPSMGNKTGSGSTKRSGYVHVATTYPSSKQVKKIPSIIESSKEAPGYSCKSCSKTFNSVGLDTHCKLKHNAHK